MNKQAAEALKPGQRVRWKSGNLSVAGRVLDQSLHPRAAENGCVAVGHGSDVWWIEIRKLHLTDEPKPLSGDHASRLQIVR